MQRFQGNERQLYWKFVKNLSISLCYDLALFHTGWKIACIIDYSFCLTNMRKFCNKRSYYKLSILCYPMQRESVVLIILFFIYLYFFPRLNSILRPQIIPVAIKENVDLKNIQMNFNTNFCKPRGVRRKGGRN